MSTLEISLALLAAAAIVVVGIYNVVIARKRGLPVSGTRGSAESGVAERSEPSLGLSDDEFATNDFSETAAGSSPRTGAQLSEIADCIVQLNLPSPVPGERLVLLTRGLRRAGSKPMTVEGCVIADLRQGTSTEDSPRVRADHTAADQHEEWVSVIGGESYTAVRVGVLLANRHGAINAMEFSEFVAGVQSLAENLAALADTPDMAGVLARARELDEACANLDAQIGIAVDVDEPLGLEDLARIAGDCDCAERGNNRYARLGAAGEVVFSMALADAPNRLSFLLDVPRSAANLDPWQQMVECARRCSQQLGGRLVDETGRALPDAQLDQIGEQLAERYQALEAAGFAAGSALALRLFN